MDKAQNKYEITEYRAQYDYGKDAIIVTIPEEQLNAKRLKYVLSHDYAVKDVCEAHHVLEVRPGELMEASYRMIINFDNMSFSFPHFNLSQISTQSVLELKMESGCANPQCFQIPTKSSDGKSIVSLIHVFSDAA